MVNFSVKYMRGADPVLKLFRSDDDHDEMSIKKWDTETIEEYLREHLLQ